MKIKYIRAQNFLSIGEKGLEIDFTKYGNIVNIKGENRDQGPGASNGAGKSTIIEIIVYSFFGELIKNLNHKEAINIKAGGKGLETEVQFEMDDHDYRIVRRRQNPKDELKLWKDGVDESKGGIPSTQEEIGRIIKLNYTAFINVVCFGQHNTKQFLGCKPSDKRTIAENLLSLDKYNKYCGTTKNKLRDLKERLKFLVIVYEKSLQEVLNSERQIKQLLKQQDEWKATQLNTIERLRGQINKVKLEMSKLTDSSSSDNYEKLQFINTQLQEEQSKKSSITAKLAIVQERMVEAKEESQRLLLASKEIQFDINRINKEIEETKNHSNNLLSQKGTTCQVCYGVIDPKNFKSVLDHNKAYVQEITDQVKLEQENLTVYLGKRKKIEDFLAQLKTIYEQAKNQDMAYNRTLRDLEQKKMIASSAYRDSANSASLILEQQIENYNEQIELKQKELEGGDPFGVVLEDTKLDLETSSNKVNELKEEINNLEKQIPYYDFWVTAFGDTGIRSFVLGEIMPILNTRINYWLQFLVDNTIRLTFNAQLDEKIERNPPDGDPFVYNAMSGGEHQRIDLGIALAFAQVMMLTSGATPNLCCLDEIGTNLDRPGIQAVYNTVCELSRERQVLVTTHDPDLLEMLAGYETISVIKEHGYTYLEK